MNNSPLETAILVALKQRLAVARISQREAERMLGLNHGVVGNLLRGRTALRIQHLELFGRLLGFTPDQILFEARALSEIPAGTVIAWRIVSPAVDEPLQPAANTDSPISAAANS